MKKTLRLITFYLLILNVAQAQTSQQKAQDLVDHYLRNKKKYTGNISYKPIQVLRSSFSETKKYKDYQFKIDSLKIAGRRIDARIAKMKTTAELDQAKKDSNRLSHELVATSDQLIDFMTGYKGTPVGWQLKAAYLRRSKSIFYLNQELTKVDSVK